MTALSKEAVISTLQAELEKQSGKAVTIEQSGSWYKIDGGKSVRFSELESMLASLTGSDEQAKPAKTSAKPAKKTATKQPTKAAVKKTESAANGGLTPKQLWRAKLEKAAGKQTLPRGF
ncbi:hypothetical protein [Shewanella gaetbuli]